MGDVCNSFPYVRRRRSDRGGIRSGSRHIQGRDQQAPLLFGGITTSFEAVVVARCMRSCTCTPALARLHFLSLLCYGDVSSLTVLMGVIPVGCHGGDMEVSE